MLKIRYDTGKGFEEIEASIVQLDKNIQAQLKMLGPATVTKMHKIIEANKVRPQAGEPTNLENNIDVEYFPNGEGWGVGNIDKLNKNAKGWRAINWGSSHMVGKHLPPGTFSPGKALPDSGSSRTGRWKKGINNGGSTYSPIVKNPILPMNYIEKTINWVKNEISNWMIR